MSAPKERALSTHECVESERAALLLDGVIPMWIPPPAKAPSPAAAAAAAAQNVVGTASGMSGSEAHGRLHLTVKSSLHPLYTLYTPPMLLPLKTSRTPLSLVLDWRARV
eukprot:938917-Prorocentrum_minimum.AAC.1